jgi:polysaccharide deacetylase family protein (PEP-CTERM system associated)
MSEQGAISDRRHILTVVLEDYCHVGPVSRFVPPDYWHRFESRVERNTHLTLDLLDEAGAKATFFVLGWIGENQPKVVAEVARRGHEIASKGFFHRSIREMNREQFREEVRHSREALENASGMPVRGYRVPRGGFGKDDLWALDILAEEGYAYDSSLRPVGLEFSNEPFRRYIHTHQHNGRSIVEVPLSSWKLGPLTVPISGGNFLRQLPHRFIGHAIKEWVRNETAPLVFYFHVWELDPEQPRINAVSRLERIRQYRNLDAMGDRIRHYLREFRFETVAGHLQLEYPEFDPARITVHEPIPTAKRLDQLAVSATEGERIEGQAIVPISVVIPCFNEEDTLGYLANTLDSFSASVRDRYDVSYVFVDDGSSDRTWERLNELFGSRKDCQVVQHPQNRGIAAATLTGIQHSPAEIVCAIDADGTFDPHQLKEMIPMLKPGVDAVTASCFHEQGQVMNVPGWRMALSKGASLLYRTVLHNKLSHYTSCFRVYRKSALADLRLRDERYVGITEILSSLDMQGSKIVEYPAVLEVRLLGQSKMKIAKTIWGHLQLIGHLASERIAGLMSPPRETPPGRRQHS